MAKIYLTLKKVLANSDFRISIGLFSSREGNDERI
jgi:hypothetical protein